MLWAIAATGALIGFGAGCLLVLLLVLRSLGKGIEQPPSVRDLLGEKRR